jgi:hypothetical protein
MADSANYLQSITPGEDWVLTITKRDGNNVLVEMEAPAFMDLRRGPRATSPRVARLDNTGTADGTITFPETGKVRLFLPASKTSLLEPGTLFSDLYVHDSLDKPMVLLKVRVMVERFVSKATP